MMDVSRSKRFDRFKLNLHFSKETTVTADIILYLLHVITVPFKNNGTEFWGYFEVELHVRVSILNI